MPGARRTRGPCAEGSKHTVVTTGAPEATRHSLHNGFTAYNALSLVTGLSCHHRPREDCFSRTQTHASGRRDHTASPSASAPFVKGADASIVSRTNVRDDRETPLWW